MSLTGLLVTGSTGVPGLDGALCTIECRLADAIAKDTHVVLIAGVIRVRHDATKAPALFFRSQLYDGFRAAAGATDGFPGRSAPGRVHAVPKSPAN